MSWYHIIYIWYQITTNISVDLMALYPLLVYVTRFYFFLSLLLDLFAGYGISFLKYMGYHFWQSKLRRSSRLQSPYIAPAFHKPCLTQDYNQGHRYPQLTSIPTQIYRTNMDPVQIYVTEVGPAPIILSCRRSSLPRLLNQYRLTWNLTKYLEYTWVIN